MSSLGVVVFSLQGMKHLNECLESVRWADVVLVLHLGAGEPLIGADSCASATFRKMNSTAEMKRLDQEIKTDWVLHLWGEERVESELKENLAALCKSGLSKVPMEFRVPIHSHLLGRWVEGSLWGPTPAPRLRRRIEEISLSWWDITRQQTDEVSGLLQGWIGDYTLEELREGVDRVQSVSGIWAAQSQDRGWGPGPWAMAMRPLEVFLQLLFLNGVFAKGLAGLTLSTLAAYATLLSGAKIWEARNVRRIAK